MSKVTFIKYAGCYLRASNSRRKSPKTFRVDRHYFSWHAVLVCSFKVKRSQVKIIILMHEMDRNFCINCHAIIKTWWQYGLRHLFWPSGSPTILVFPHQTGSQYSDAPRTGSRMQGGIKNNDFRPISRFISQMMQGRAIFTMEGE